MSRRNRESRPNIVVNSVRTRRRFARLVSVGRCVASEGCVHRCDGTGGCRTARHLAGRHAVDRQNRVPCAVGSSNGYLTLGTHYAGAWIGYVVVAFAFAVRSRPDATVKRLLYACLVFCAIELSVADPLHPGMNLRYIQPRDVALDRALLWLPAKASVATQEEAYTHLALTDPNATLLPERAGLVPDACYVLIDRNYPTSVILLEYGSAFRNLVKNGTYRLVRREGKITLYHRVGACK